MLGDSLKRRRGKTVAREVPKPKARGGPPWLSWQGWLLLALVVVLTSFGVGYLLATQVVFPRPETADAGIAVPELYGQTRPQAAQAIRAAGLTVGEVREMASMREDAGQVLAQDPLPGQQLFPGGVVSLGVSTGRPELRVPPVAGLGVSTARDLLETLGFDVAVERTRSGERSEGLVIRAEPAAGTPRLLPAQVTLVVSSGSPDELSDTTPDTPATGGDGA